MNSVYLEKALPHDGLEATLLLHSSREKDGGGESKESNERCRPTGDMSQQVEVFKIKSVRFSTFVLFKR